MRKNIRIIILNGCGLINDLDGELTVSTIDEVKNGSTGMLNSTKGIVIEDSQDGILVQDETGFIFVAIDNGTFVIGDEVILVGTTESYGDIIQMSSSTVVTLQNTSSFTETRLPQEVNENNIDSLITSVDVGDFLTFEGTARIDDQSFILTFGETSTEIYMFTDADNTDWINLNNKKVHVTGYALNVTNNQLNMILVSCEEVLIPEVSFDKIQEQYIRVGEYIEVDWTTFVLNPTSNLSASFTYEVSDGVNYDMVGVYDVTIDVIDDLGNSTSQTFQVFVEDDINLIKNGAFNGGTGEWNFSNGNESGGNGILTYENGIAAITVLTPVEEGWGPRLESSIVEFEYGKTYEISFSAKALEERTIGVQVGELLDAYPWFDDYLRYRYIFDLSTTWRSFSFVFTMNDPSGEGQLLFNMGKLDSYLELGNYNTTIYFDDISIVELTYPPEIWGVYDITIFTGAEFDEMQYVDAYDFEDGDITNDIIVTGEVDVNTPGTYILTYEVTDSSGNYISEERIITVVQLNVIADVLEGEIGAFYILFATVVATEDLGFIVTDGADYIYVYTYVSHGVSIGDELVIEGTSSTFGGAVQFRPYANYYILDYGVYIETRNPVYYSGADIEILQNNFLTGMLIEVEGTISVDGSYVNLIIDGTTIIGSLDAFGSNIDLTLFDGLDVTITGYLLFFTGSNGEYMDVIVISIEENVQ